MDEAEKAARDYALTLLSRRSYTQKELYGKLERRHGEEPAVAALERMIELGLLDDEALAERMAENCINVKGFSPGRTAMELARRGIDREIVENVASRLSDDVRPAIARIIERKYSRFLVDEKGRKKTINALLRLGYGYGDIAATLRDIGDDAEYYEDWEQENE